MRPGAPASREGRPLEGLEMRTKCECADRQCPVHRGAGKCVHWAIETLYRVDMYDRTGTAFCGLCVQDASESGLFSDEAPQRGAL